MKNAFAVIDHDDEIVDVLDNFDSALAVAKNNNAWCIETLKNYDGVKGRVIDTYWMENNFAEMVFQKIVSIILFIGGILSIIPDRDFTFAILIIPIAIYTFFTSDSVLA